ncbi:hypothetical protein MRX96_018537 [Rhipicephalus microplus]
MASSVAGIVVIINPDSILFGADRGEKSIRARTLLESRLFSARCPRGMREADDHDDDASARSAASRASGAGG